MFMLLLADLDDEKEGVALLHELRQYLQLPFRLAGRSIDLSCTMGYAVFPRDAQDVETLFNTADTALREAKSLGHGSIKEYARGPWVPQTSLLLEQDLRHALEREQLFLDYQPKVDLATGRVSGFEALVRWRHPERGLVSPADFIPLAEASGLIVDIGRWVLHEACRQLRAWLDLDLPGPAPTMAVNLSARQFREPDLVETVEHSLLTHGLAPASLELELTETASMFDSARAIAVTHQLHALGIKLSIDDFGTGFSSLSYLKDLSVDKIKIDRSFVTGIAFDARALAVLESIVDTARRLNLATTAEGVETGAQLDLLRQAGCTEYQGFLFSRPIAPAACEALLRRALPPLDRGDAEDVLQEVYTTIWRKAAQFDASRASAITWLAMIARNKSIDRLRASPASMRTAPIEFADDVPDSADTPPEATDTTMQNARLDQCMQRLDGRRRSLIRTAFFEGATYEELAARVGSPLGSVKSWIRRGLAQLKACLEQ
ncbi:MAG: RNA polymerase sigma-70 factor [uncultured Lysobacter sp.]|uniref:cyclic-guanylate-specific phosphodiesterase n=1 Tax=uncultured Lysobacter sp. TaxID=271060 RepID=A0A6J4L2N3_9GAMM|nr:MAG: RNA polymerase sigma-70 factor [uncultured Lysobacter sp.]